MGMYDEVARHAGKLDGFVLFQWIGRRDPFLAYSFDSWEDARRISLPGQPDRTNDLVALLQPQDPNRPPAWGIVEVQAEPERLIFARLGVYQLLLLQELDSTAKTPTEPLIRSVLLNLTGESPVEGWESALPGLAVKPIVINLKNESATQLLQEIEAGQLGLALLPWVPLMNEGGNKEVIDKWKELAGREPSEERRRMFCDFALIFAELSKKLVLWQRALEGWQMLESQLILGVLKRGKEEGRVETRRAYIEEFIRSRLADPVPEDIFLAIEGTNDPTILDRWFKLAIEVSDVAEFRKRMKLI